MRAKFGMLEQTQGLHLHAKFHLNVFFKEHQRVWESTAGYRQSRLFLKGPDKNLARYALGLSRKHLCVLTLSLIHI